MVVKENIIELIREKNDWVKFKLWSFLLGLPSTYTVTTASLMFGDTVIQW